MESGLGDCLPFLLQQLTHFLKSCSRRILDTYAHPKHVPEIFYEVHFRLLGRSVYPDNTLLLQKGVKESRSSGYKIKVFAVEGGARGFVGSSVYCLMKELGFTSKSLNRTTKALSEAAEKASSWIWSRRNKSQLHKA